MEIRDSIKLRGHLKIRVLGLDKKPVRVISIPNTVCVGAQYAFQRLCLQKTAGESDYNRVWSIWAGNDATAANSSQTQLVSADSGPTCWFRKALAPIEHLYEAGGTLGVFTVQMTMEANEGNGAPAWQFSEVGLFTRGDNDNPYLVTPGTGATQAKMVARQTHPIIEKDATISIEYNWSLFFEV